MKSIRILWFLAIAAAGVLLPAMPALQQGKSAEVLLGAALHQEEVEGNLEAAIGIYKKILADHPGNRPLAATALLRMGQCYERLGKDEARKAYERLVLEYADQPEQAEHGRRRLAALAGPRPAALTIRRLENPPQSVGAVSLDGRYMSFSNWQGNLAVRDLQTGENRRLTSEGNLGEIGAAVTQQAWKSAWSPDGKQIVYAWYIRSDAPRVELRAVEFGGGKYRILAQFDTKDLRELGSLTWSADGKQVAACLYPRAGRVRLVLISAADGTMRTITEMEREIYPITARFSPDGRYIAYDQLPDRTSPKRDIFLTSIQTGEAVPLIQHPADDYLLEWSQDAKWIVFASDRTGTLGLWIAGLSGPKAQGEPQLIRSGIDRMLPIGLTREGAMYYSVIKATEDDYVVDLDPKTARVSGSPRKVVEHFEGGNFSPAYSPDGKYLAYVSRRGNSPHPTNVGNALCVRSLATGQEQVYYGEIWKLGIRLILGLAWSPDSRSLIFAGEEEGSIRGAYRIHLDTGVITNIVRSGPEEGISGIAYGPDGKYFLARGNRKENFSQIVVREIESGEERELHRIPMLDMFLNIALSPGGDWLSFVNSGWGAVRSLQLMPASGGEAREIWNFGETKSGMPPVSHTWAPDGSHILFSAPDPADLPTYDLWRVSIEGGKPEKIGLQRKWGIWGLSVRPDGRQLAFAGRGGASTDSELWVMEQFLPAADTAKR